MGLSLDTPINFDVLLINTFITQLPVVFGELGCVSLAGVFERRFVISIATFELGFRETIVVFLGMIWGTDRCFVNNILYSHAVSFQRAVFRFITVALTTSATYTLYIYIYITPSPCKIYNNNIYTQVPCVYSQSSWESFLLGMNSLLCSMWDIVQLVPIRFWRWVMAEWLERWTQQWAAEGVFEIVRPAFETELQREAIRSYSEYQNKIPWLKKAPRRW